MRLKPILAAAATMMAVALTHNASALIVGPSSPDWTGNDSSDLTDAQISGILNANSFNVGNLGELYRQDLNGGESGAYAGSYQTTFSNTPDEPQDANIIFGGGLSITGFDHLWLYVKDGDARPAYYLIDLLALGWNGTADLELRAFWPQDGSITQVRILGSNSASVPDGGMTFALLSSALAGLGVVRFFGKR